MKRPRSGRTIAWRFAVAYLVFGTGHLNLTRVYLAHRANVGRPSDLSLDGVWAAMDLLGWPIFALAGSADMSMRNAAVPVPWMGPISLALLVGFAAVFFLWVLRRPQSIGRGPSGPRP